jgi:hypothetical protein
MVGSPFSFSFYRSVTSLRTFFVFTSSTGYNNNGLQNSKTKKALTHTRTCFTRQEFKYTTRVLFSRLIDLQVLLLSYTHRSRPEFQKQDGKEEIQQ